MPRSGFLTRLGVVFGALLGGAGAATEALRTPLAAVAAPKITIGTTIPAVSRIGLYLGNIKSLKPNAALAFTDPRSGDPAILIRLPNGKVVSYDMVCPHQGCTVPYDPARQRLVCPCHGAQFDPAHGAAPLSGPVSDPLFTIPIRVDSAGNVYALDAAPGTRVNRLRAAPSPAAGSEDDRGSDDRSTGRHRRRRGDD